VYNSFAGFSNIVYFFDLIGAALGSLAVLIFLDHFGAINTVFLISVLSSIASISLAFFSRKKRVIYLTIICFILISSFTLYIPNNYNLNLPIGSEPIKSLYGALSDPSYDAEIIDSRWSSFGLTSLIALKENTDFRVVFVDGSAGSTMFRFDGI